MCLIVLVLTEQENYWYIKLSTSVILPKLASNIWQNIHLWKAKQTMLNLTVCMCVSEARTW